MDTHISQKGMAQTVVIDNNKKNINSTKWNAKYDGETANILVNTNTNGHKSKYLIELDNNDIADLFSVPSVNEPLDIRLKNDYTNPRKHKHSIPSTPYMIEMDNQSLKPTKMNDTFYTHVSSPSYGEQFLIPVPINNPKTRKHKKHKKHRTYHIKKYHKYTPRRHSTPRRKYRRSKSKSSSSTKRRRRSY